jgi:hypothetical protein
MSAAVVMKPATRLVNNNRAPIAHADAETTPSAMSTNRQSALLSPKNP